MQQVEHLLLGFPRVLREAGISVDPSKSLMFLQAVTRAELQSLGSLRRISRITMISSPNDFEIHDAVFKSWFELGDQLSIAAENSDDERQTKSPKGTPPQTGETDLGDMAGQDASREDSLGKKAFSRTTQRLAPLAQAVKAMPWPKHATRSWSAAPQARRIDMQSTCRAARRTFGDPVTLARLARPHKLRNALILIDVSGSMKLHSEAYLRVAHQLARRMRGVEVFSFSTRLTRITKAMRHRNVSTALQKLSTLVFGFDGGTRIGDSMEEFLSVSRYAALVRSSVTIVISDGLERGSTDVIAKSTERLAKLSHRLHWFTPLASDPRYKPVTRAMTAILPFLDGLAPASDEQSMVAALAGIAQNEPAARRQAHRTWQERKVRA